VKNTIKTVAFLAALAGLLPAAHAEDIDIYGTNGGGPKPNIIIVFDNASRNNSNFSGTCPYSGITSISTLQDATRCALAVAVSDIASQPALLGKFNMGLLVYGYQNNQGGQWIIPSITPGATNVSTSLPTMDQAGISAFLAAVTPPINTANEASASGGMQEAWAFITGSPAAATEVFGSKTTYVSHEGLSCQKSFIIFIGSATGNNGEPETGSNGSGGAGGAAGLANAGATVAQQRQINTSLLGSNTGDDSAWGDEWARFLNQTDFSGTQANSQNVVTYTIATGGTRPNYVQFLHSMADQGGGKPFVAADINSMVQALLQIFNEIQSVNSVFASSSLPISANAQGTYLNQVFIGMFRPDGSANPRWMGNLKQYQFGVGGTPSNPTLFLADKNSNPAISGNGSGFISPTAVSFWNPDVPANPTALPDSIGGFWVNDPQSAGGGYDNPDGEIVEKGGVGEQIRLANLQDNYTTNPSSPRNVYTCTGSSGSCNNGAALSATPFATTNSSLTNASFGITPPTSSISSFSRSGTTVTATLSAAPSPALTDGQSVTIQGASSSELNGIFTITLVNSTTFTYTIVVSPPTPATGSYTASVPSSPKTITSLTRVGTTVTATSNGHNYNVGDIVTITGATGSQYNGSYPIISTTSNTFTYTISDAPGSATSGGTADLGTTHTQQFAFTASQITRDTTHSDNTSIVTITAGSNLNTGYATGAKINVSGVTPSGYNTSSGSPATIIAGGGNNTGDTCPGGSKQKSVCYSITTTPGTPDSGGTPKVDRTATSALSSLTRTVACTGSTPTPTSTVTATTTSSTSPFSTGDSVSIAGNPVGANESAYVGTFTITATGTKTFTYSTTTTPSCAPSASGATAITGTTGIDKNSLINWVRGDDNIGDEPSPDSGVITIRPSVHGDVLHSRPTVVNYGGSIGVVVFYGANDGTFRAVNGNQPLNGSLAIGSASPGGEIWSFIPTEFFSKLPRLYLNSPSVKLASTPTGITPTPLPKDYTFDGSTGVYQTFDPSTGATTRVTLFLSERRGGRFIYAIDVTDPTAPKLKWKKSSTDTDMGELGLTWSVPKAAIVRGVSNPVVIFGAGYDTNEDSEPPATDTMGRGIFVLDATDGSIVWRAGSGGASAGTCTGTPCLVSDMTYAIPADVALINRDFDTTGYIDRMYAADLGGNIWRVDLEPAGYAAPGAAEQVAGTGTNMVGPSTWKLTKFAAVGGSSNATKRKFFYPPDVVATKPFDMVLAATGDREHPLYSANNTQSYSIVNRFYGFKDLNTGASVPSNWSTSSEIVDDTSDTATSNPAVSNMTDVTPTTSNSTPTPYDPNTANNGFYITFMSAGEKGVNAPLTVGGFTYVGTNTPQVPTSSTCTTLGTARGYAINFLTGAAIPGGSLYTTFATGGLPPSPVAGLVDVVVNGKDRLVPFCLGCGDPTGAGGVDATSSIGGGKPKIPIPPIRKRIYWYLDKHDAS
jgi:type IV pilus assembly protein PilY1